MRIWVLVLLLILAIPVEAAHTIKIVRGNTAPLLSDHMGAIGAVLSLDKEARSLGTGTYIGDSKIVTAAHVLKFYLPKHVPQKSGPVVTDLSKKQVFWTNDVDFGRGDPIQNRYRITKVVTDACFINAGGKNALRPTIDMIKCDVAILKLEQDPQNIQKIALVDHLPSLPPNALHVGYGDGEMATPDEYEKKIRVQVIAGEKGFDQWRLFFTNLSQNQDIDSAELSSQSFGVSSYLTNRPLNHEELSITKAKVGDSGGPLIAKAADNSIRIIGILSAYSDIYNSFPSLMIRESKEYTVNPLVQQMLRAIR